MTSVHIDVCNLTMAYGSRVVQEHLNFHINRGDIFIIMGGSGCGKSTLLKHMIGLYQPRKGDIKINGQSISHASRQHRIEMTQSWGVTFQSGALFSDLTLAENVSIPLRQHTKLSKGDIAERAHFKLALVGLAGFEDYYPAEISGGMQKRAGLARAIALDPELLFFDEPSAGLDPLSARLLDELILELRETLGSTFVIVTHELESIFTIGTNSVFLDPVRRTQLDCGKPSDLLHHSHHVDVRKFLRRGAPEPEPDAQSQ